MSASLKSKTKARGSEAVQMALIEAACSLLAEVGPRTLSVRDIADRAGVNHGQIHHYFGGKSGLLAAAMRHLAQSHYDQAQARAGNRLIPPPLSLAEDTQYWRALCHSIMDGHMDLARIETHENISIPKRVLQSLQEENPQEDPLAIKAAVAANAAMQLGWVAFEEFMFEVTEVKAKERKALREAVKLYIEKNIDHRFGSTYSKTEG